MGKLSWEFVVEKLFWLMLLGIISFGVSQIKSGAESVEDLNLKVSVLIKDTANQKSINEIYERRLENLESAATVQRPYQSGRH